MKTSWVFCLTIGKFLYYKYSIKPPGGLFNFGHSREGGLFTKSNDKDIYDSSISSFTPYFVDSTHIDTVLSQNISKLTLILFNLNKLKVFGSSVLNLIWGFILVGGLIERGGLWGGLFKFWLRGLSERGAQ